ncbi:type II secretion system F family protein [Actinocorallia sp. A-T 12471]|uniref:type II secretion system F family protein n=1 Tax=Actinocorallia sp. A-T 12471 TaxID=3089813 RepID=UPI0029CB097A|nr:type II secretion system F family protein [Actinocorallia sp. A-T 12471]MDX6744534.1 type II secretion system F family protein [Actinocorallia sp. A-T 12471]
MNLGIDVLYALFAGGLACGGLCLLVMAVRGTPVKPQSRKRSREDLVRALGTRTGIAVIAGLGTLVVTRWVVVAVGIGLLVLGWDAVAGGAAEERRSMSRLEGLANWAESLRDTIAGAVGLEQAIPSSVRAASPALQPALRALVDRMHTRVPLPEALRRFADDLDDSSADLIIAALILNARLRGPGLREMLGALAASARTELEMRRRVNAYRAMTRRSVQIVVGFSVGFALLVSVFNPSYVAPYNSVTGQLVLGLIVGLYALGFFWLRRLAKFQAPERLLGATEAEPVDAGKPLRGRAAMDAGVGR